MASAVGSLLRRVTRKKEDKISVLTFDTHESYQVEQAKCNCEFYSIQAEGIKTWDNRYRIMPSNYTQIGHPNNIPIDLDFDVILSQNRGAHWGIANQLSKILHIPLINLEHVLPAPNFTPDIIRSWKQMGGDINVFITHYNAKVWRYEENECVVIYHGIDCNLFSPDLNIQKTKHILSVVNLFRQRDWCCGFNFWEQATCGLPRYHVGHDPGFSEAADSVEGLVNKYREAQIFINTSLVSPVPTSLLEAAACGTCIVSTKTCSIPEFFTHKENAYLSDSPEEMKKHLEMLLNNEDECNRIGINARKTVQEKFSSEAFVNKWNNLFRKAVNRSVI